jgi:hypothetical protein
MSYFLMCATKTLSNPAGDLSVESFDLEAEIRSTFRLPLIGILLLTLQFLNRPLFISGSKQLLPTRHLASPDACTAPPLAFHLCDDSTDNDPESPLGTSSPLKYTPQRTVKTRSLCYMTGTFPLALGAADVLLTFLEGMAASLFKLRTSASKKCVEFVLIFLDSDPM